LPIEVIDTDTGNISRLYFPGKSAVILIAENCDRELVGEFTKYFFRRKIDRRDHLHTATVGDLRNAGWVPYYAPLQIEGYVPHARLVSQRTITGNEQPTIEDVQLLAKAFKKAV
jgi:hypothetical protein